MRASSVTAFSLTTPGNTKKHSLCKWSFKIQASSLFYQPAYFYVMGQCHKIFTLRCFPPRSPMTVFHYLQNNSHWCQRHGLSHHDQRLTVSSPTMVQDSKVSSPLVSLTMVKDSKVSPSAESLTMVKDSDVSSSPVSLTIVKDSKETLSPVSLWPWSKLKSVVVPRESNHAWSKTQRCCCHRLSSAHSCCLFWQQSCK